ncbi:Uncharacterised protein [Raoultella planticola]|nr:Uncharacterised protein [Raoultella planticola]
MFKLCVEVTTLNTLHNKMRTALVFFSTKIVLFPYKFIPKD